MNVVLILALAAILSVVLTLGLLWRGHRVGEGTATRRSAPRSTRDLSRWHQSGEVVE